MNNSNNFGNLNNGVNNNPLDNQNTNLNDITQSNNYGNQVNQSEFNVNTNTNDNYNQVDTTNLVKETTASILMAPLSRYGTSIGSVLILAGFGGFMFSGLTTDSKSTQLFSLIFLIIGIILLILGIYSYVKLRQLRRNNNVVGSYFRFRQILALIVAIVFLISMLIQQFRK